MDVPQAAQDTARYAQTNNGDAPPGQVGNRPFANDGRNGGQVLDRQVLMATRYSTRSTTSIRVFRSPTVVLSAS
jgi:hypothetical protein